MFKLISVDDKEIEIEDSCEDECPQCGEQNTEIFFVPDWMVHRCYGCLMDEAKKYHYKIKE